MFIAVVLVGPFSAGGLAAPGKVPACSVPGQITRHPSFWYSIKVPSFPSGSQLISEYAVDPRAPEHMYVTNGSVVMRSSDSGCHWSLSYSLPQTGAGPTVANATILEIEVASPGIAYLPIQQSGPTPKPHVMVSQDAGATWTAADGPLLNASVGTIRDLDASHGNGSAAAVLVDVEYTEPGVISVEGHEVMFFTDRAGEVWEPRHIFRSETSVGAGGLSVEVTGDGDLRALTMNPVRPNEVWLYGEAGVFRSDGANVAAVNLGSLSVLDVSLDGAAVAAFEQSAPSGSISVGQDFQQVTTGFVVDSLDVALSIPLAALGSLGRVYYWGPLTGLGDVGIADVSPRDGRAVSDVQVSYDDETGELAFYGRTPKTIEVRYGPPPDDDDDDDDITSMLSVDVEDLEDNLLVPSSKRVVMRPGGRETIPYDLAMPAANTPLDVYFMIDISGSMQGTINGVRAAMQEIANRLVERGLDVRFGVGSFRSYSDPPAYSRDRDIGPPDSAMAAALNSLQARGGGAETQMAALLQSATGKGEAGIPAGLNMHFRPGSLRVAVEATDEPISQGGSHPTLDTVVAGLVAHDVKMVGLAIQEPPLLGEPNYENPGQPASGLQIVAEGSKAIAPVGGVDCDGDGEPEIPQGGPIVCMIDPDRADDAALMADAIVNVLQAVQDIQDLDVSVTPANVSGSPTEALESIDPESLPSVDLKEPSEHGFEVTVRCPHVQRKTTYPLKVAVSRPGRELASATLTVVCKPLPTKERKEVAPFLVPLFPIAAILPPPPRPPEPVAEPNPHPNPNPQQNLQGQAGFAAQEQKQPQLALAHQKVADPAYARQLGTDEYFFSAHRESRVPPAAFVFTAGMIISLLAYVTALQRTRTARALSRRSRRR